jgi:hypothetical protein
VGRPSVLELDASRYPEVLGLIAMRAWIAVAKELALV